MAGMPRGSENVIITWDKIIPVSLTILSKKYKNSGHPSHPSLLDQPAVLKAATKLDKIENVYYD